MKVLGINDQHNASACLLVDGQVVAALQEERLSRIKNHFCFPQRAIAWLLAETETAPEELDGVAVASEHIWGPFTGEDLIRSYRQTRSPKTRARAIARKTPLMEVRKRQRRRQRLDDVARAGLPVERTAFVEHHTAHAAAAYQGGPWDDDLPTLVITADGQGDGLSASIRIGQGRTLLPALATVAASDSIGSVYATITALQGMVPLEHEYKLMGLAPYAPASGAARSRAVFDALFEPSGPHGLSWQRRGGVPDMDYAYPWLRRRLEMHRFDWVAAGLQEFVEDHLAEWVRRAVERTGIRRVALGGGVFMNVKANQRIYELDEVEDLFVFPSCGDETNSMGAAFHWQVEHAGKVSPIGPLYWGPTITEAEVEAELPALRGKGYGVERCEDVEVRVAGLLAEGAVVARAKGRTEFGARSLGNRSILADPTRPDVVRVINDMVKNRDFWMPFAPSILEEHSDRYLRNPKGMAAPYMIITFDTTDRVGDLAGAVQPYDRTARPQVVRRDHNPDYHRLISEFARLTGRGAILNTSFNLHGYPIVTSARDAVEVLERSGLTHLALDDHLITKPAG